MEPEQEAGTETNHSSGSSSSTIGFFGSPSVLTSAIFVTAAPIAFDDSNLVELDGVSKLKVEGFGYNNHHRHSPDG